MIADDSFEELGLTSKNIFGFFLFLKIITMGPIVQKQETAPVDSTTVASSIQQHVGTTGPEVPMCYARHRDDRATVVRDQRRLSDLNSNGARAVAGAQVGARAPARRRVRR